MNTDLTSIGYRVQTIEELKVQVPAAFSEMPHPDRTERYSLFSTEEFLTALAKLGWDVYSAKQHGANPFSRHIIRLHNDEFGFIPVEGDKIKPHLMLDNSHDGYTTAQIHLGLFRVVSESGLVAAIPGLNNTVKFRHVGIDQKTMIEILAETAEQYRTMAGHIKEMQSIILTPKQKRFFAMEALALREPTRFVNEDGTPNEKEIEAAMDYREILTPVRPQDAKDDLWTVFNLIQERTVKGLYERKSKKGRKANPRAITNAARHLEFNKKLWTLAETFMPSAEVETEETIAIQSDSDVRIYKTAKGEEKEVTIVSDLGNGRTQVKDINANRIFAVATDKLVQA